MKKSTLVSLGILVAAVLALLMFRQGGAPEPTWQGQPVSTWALALNSPSPATRQKADEVIRSWDSNAVPALVRLLRTPDPILARPVKAIGRRAPGRMSRVLFRIVNPFDAPSKRASAAHALRIMGPKAQLALPALSHALHAEPTVAWHAALAVAQLGEPGLTTLIQALPETPPPQGGFICYALSTQGPSASNAIPVLATVLRTGCPDTAEKAARALGSVGRRAVPSLIQSLSGTNVPVQVLTINALAAMGPLARDALPRLIELSKADPLTVREASIAALTQIRPTAETVIDALAAALTDSAREVRLKALQGLGRSPEASKKAAAIVIGLLKDADSEVRGVAASLLGEMSGSREPVVPALVEALNDEDERVRARARQSLGKLRASP